MHFCVSMLKFYFYYLILCQRFGSAKYLFSLKNQSSFVVENCEEMIEKLYVDLNKHYLQMHKVQHITVVGGSINDLRRLHLFHEDYPYSLCTKAEKCFDLMKFSSQSLILFFLNDLSKTTLNNNKNIEFLLRSRNECKILIIFKGKAKYDKISSFYSEILKHSPAWIELLKIGINSVRFYRPIVNNNCSMEILLDFIWKPGRDLSQIHSKRSSAYNLNGCSITISTLRYMPKMAIEKNKNKKARIIGGRDGLLVLLIAEKLNFTINILDPPKYENVNSSRKLAIINQVASGKADIGVGRLRPTSNLDNRISSTIFHDNDCIIWAVPHIMSGIENIFWSEYSWDVWALIGLVFILSCVIGYAYHSSSIRKQGNRNNVGLIAIILDILAVNLGNPGIYLTLTTGGRLLLVSYLAYTTVITTGYKTSLNSALTTVRNTPAINNARKIITANLSVGGSFYYYQILMDQVNASDVNRELISRYIIYNNASEAFERLKHDHDFALLDRKADLNYIKSTKDQSYNFNTLNECVSKYYIVMVVKKGSSLLKPINQIIRRVMESGIQKTWAIDKPISNDKNSERLYAEYTRQILISFSKFYCSALAVCTLIFFMELIIPKFKFKKKNLKKNHRIVDRPSS